MFFKAPEALAGGVLLWLLCQFGSTEPISNTSLGKVKASAVGQSECLAP